MTHNFYIKVFRLTEAEAETFLALAGAQEDPEFKAALKTYANRWIMEIRGNCESEATCRAIMFRYIMDTTIEAGAPEKDRMVTVAWAQMLTDRIQEIVEACEKDQQKN